MAFDQHKNLAIATVVNSPGAAGVSLIVAAGEGARMPAVPFNATVWPATELPTPVNAEVVRVTARTTDTLTITRAQEGTTARAIVAGDLFAATITAKSLTDIESGTNFPLITTPGDITMGAGGSGAAHSQFIINGTDAADKGAFITFKRNNTIFAYLGRAAGLLGGSTNAVTLMAQEPEGLELIASSPGAPIVFRPGGTVVRGKMHGSGGFSWGGTTDPGAGNFTLGNGTGGANTRLVINGPSSSFGSQIVLQQTGTECGGVLSGAAQWGGSFTHLVIRSLTADGLDLVNTHAAGKIRFVTGPGNDERGRIHASGGFSWGGTTDPGAAGRVSIGDGNAAAVGSLMLGTNVPIAQNAQQYIRFQPGTTNGLCFSPTVDTATAVLFLNAANSLVGTIATTAGATAYNTTSDARLKTSRGRHTDPDVLRRTIIHDFIWQSDGTPGRGVFAQEAFAVAPFAVSVGGDEVDDEGRLTKPWGVDYSKYVPDLITGWQDHDAELVKLRADVAILTQRLAWPPARSIDLPLPSVYQRIRAVLAGWFPAWITP